MLLKIEIAILTGGIILKVDYGCPIAVTPVSDSNSQTSSSACKVLQESDNKPLLDSGVVIQGKN